MDYKSIEEIFQFVAKYVYICKQTLILLLLMVVINNWFIGTKGEIISFKV